MFRSKSVIHMKHSTGKCKVKASADISLLTYTDFLGFKTTPILQMTHQNMELEPYWHKFKSTESSDRQARLTETQSNMSLYAKL